jgi:peptidoglycan hydrolase CwlO-like protein
MIREFIAENFNSIVIFILGVGAWFTERHKRKADQVDTAKSIVSMYREAIEDLKKSTDSKIEVLQTNVNTFKAQIDRLEKELNSWKTKYTNLKADFDKYKKNHQ